MSERCLVTRHTVVTLLPKIYKSSTQIRFLAKFLFADDWGNSRLMGISYLTILIPAGFLRGAVEILVAHRVLAPNIPATSALLADVDLQ